MEMCLNSIAVILVFLFSLISTGESLKCHVCSSLTNESCAELVDNRYLTECFKINNDPDRNHTICRTETISASSTAFEMYTQRTIRSCGYTKHPKYDCFYNSNIDLKESICECEEDGCNGSSVMQFSIQILALAFLLNCFMKSTLR